MKDTLLDLKGVYLSDHIQIYVANTVSVYGVHILVEK